jgi:SAM-dependent methyltransferase
MFVPDCFLSVNRLPIYLAALLLSACATQVPVTVRTIEPPAPPPAPVVKETPRTAIQQQLINEATNLAPLATSEFSRRFLQATESLPAVATRVAFRDDNTREFFSPTETDSLPEERRKKLTRIELDEYRYYYTKYGTPLAYIRALDLSATQGINDWKGARILDFGYGSIGHLRLMASLGAHAVGVDPDSYLSALYREPSDQGAVLPAHGLHRGVPGTITLAHGRWPKDAAIVEKVTVGGPYQLMLSKNTLKRGYLKPERRVNKNQLIDLGVSDEAFLKSVHDALAPGGLLVIYNLAPKQAHTDKPYLPHADARSPFSREQFAQAGFTVISFDTEDHDYVRRMGATLGWDKNDRGETISDLANNLFALYTIVRRAQ